MLAALTRTGRRGMDKEMVAEILHLRENKTRAALVTVVRTLGSTPREPGAKMLVVENGQSFGSIGGGCAEAEVVGRARTAIQFGQPELYRLDMTAEVAAEEGMACGGIMEVFIEPLAFKQRD